MALFRRKNRLKATPKSSAAEGDIKIRIDEIGRDLLAGMASKPGGFGGSGFTANLVQSVMEDPEFKVEMFRFVDVLPVLSDADEVARHIDEYFNRDGGPDMPGWMRAGAKLAGSGFAKGLVASQIERNVVAMARQFIAGETGAEALPRLRKMRKEGLSATVDLLGEKTLGQAEAEAYRGRYLEVLESLAADSESWADECHEQASWGRVPRVNLSIKLSALDPHFDALDREGLLEQGRKLLGPLVRRAKELGAFINVDMEDNNAREATFWLFEQLAETEDLSDWDGLGIVVQAYLNDSLEDLERLRALAERRGTPITVRLVKGAYWDAEVIQAQQEGWSVPVYLNKADTDANYERLTRYLLDHIEWLRPAIASHNARSIAVAMAEAEARNIPAHDVEFQMLYGMAEGLMDAVSARGYRLRIYTPVGEMLPGMAYLVRRLLENTSNEGWLVQAGEGLSAEQLLADPVSQGGDAEAPARETRSIQLGKSSEPTDFANEPLTHPHRIASQHQWDEAVAELEGKLPLRVQPCIGGEFEAGEDAPWERESPNRSDVVVAHVEGASLEQADKAMARALNAFAQWSSAPVSERAQLLFNLADELRKRRLEATALMALEVGKSLPEADADVAEAIDFCEYYARQAITLQTPRPLQGSVPGESNTLCYSARGPAVVIAPWNFPLAILAGMTAAAAVVGNTVLMKPAEQSSAIADLLMRAIQAAGFPSDVIQLLPGRGERVGATLVNDPRTSIVAFTGSMDVGLKIIQAAGVTATGQAQVRRVVCEMGGKNAIIVDDDADLDEAVYGVVKSAFGFAGQKCSACSRVIVLDKIHDAFCARLKDAVDALHIGSSTQPGMDFGPVVDAEALAKVTQYQRLGAEEGELLAQSLPPEGGHFAAATVYQGIQGDDRLAQEEVFGPVLAVLRARDFDHAFELANGTRFALTGGLYSRSPLRIEEAKRRFAVGNLYINRTCTGALVERHPFGGFKMSGIGGKAGGPDYLLQFVDARHVCENDMRRGFAPDLGSL
jgi:RHH-type proline utilization regulon transcriptional repressor/proline dehydrogenase/delta 1-pyrroline-5-carboxylate dehydrogenase